MSKTYKDSELLQAVADIYGELPHDQVLMIDRISVLLRNTGMHGLGRPGAGTSPLSLRPFDADRGDTRGDISNLYSRIDRNRSSLIVLEREREVQNRYFIWIDPTRSMDFASRPGLPTKGQAGLILALAMAKKMLEQGDAVAFSDGGSHRPLTTHTIGKPVDASLTIFSNASFRAGRSLPPGSTVILIGDFYDEQDTVRVLDELRQKKLNVCLITLADPQEVSFDLPETTIYGMEDERTPDGRMNYIFNKVVQGQAQQLYRDRIENLGDECAARGVSFYFQRTDKLFENNCLVEMMQHVASSTQHGRKSYHLGSLSGLDLNGGAR